MVFEISIPEINSKPKAAKDAVITLLTSRWPLSLREIFYKLKKEQGYSATYQSIYKAVKELYGKGILRSKEKKYEIDVNWVKRLQTFTDIIETNYYAKERIHNISGVKESRSEKNLIVLTFENVSDAEKYIYYFMKNELIKKTNDCIVYEMNHLWQPLIYFRAEYNYYTRLLAKGHAFHLRYNGDSESETECMEFYKRIGVDVKKSRLYFSHNLLVFQDYFIEIFIPAEIEKKMEDYLTKKDKLGLLEKALNQKTDIKIIIQKDQSLADEIKRGFRKND